MGSQTAYYSFSSSEWSFVSPSSALSSSWGGSKFVSKFSAACVSSNGSTGGASSWTNVVLLLVLRNETLELLVFSLEHGVILSLNQSLWLSTKIKFRWVEQIMLIYILTHLHHPQCFLLHLYIFCNQICTNKDFQHHNRLHQFGTTTSRWIRLKWLLREFPIIELAQFWKRYTIISED